MAKTSSREDLFLENRSKIGTKEVGKIRLSQENSFYDEWQQLN